MGLLSQLLSLHVISHLSLLSSLYIWPHLLTISASLPRFLFITVLLTPLYFLIFFLSPSVPCGVSIWRSDSEGHSKGRGGLERGMKSLDERRKTLSVYKWVKRDICIFFLCANNMGPQQVGKKLDEGCPLPCFSFVHSVSEDQSKSIMNFQSSQYSLFCIRDGNRLVQPHIVASLAADS